MKRRGLIQATAMLAVVSLVFAGCAGDDSADPPAGSVDEDASNAARGGDGDASEVDTGEPSTAGAGAFDGDAIDLLPDDTRGVFRILLADALSGGSADDVAALMAGERNDVMLADVFVDVGRLGLFVDDLTTVESAVVVQLADAVSGRVVLATLDDTTLVAGLDEAGTHDGSGATVLTDGSRSHVAAIGANLVAVGGLAAVNAVLDEAVADDGAATFVDADLGVLDSPAPFSFALALPGAIADVGADRSLRGATVVTGSFDLDEQGMAGELAFTTDNAASFVETYNGLDRHALGADGAAIEPLRAVDGRVVVPVPAMPIDGTADAETTRNLFKKLFVGMEAHDYAEDVVDGGAPWFDLIGTSEADGGDPPTPASTWFRWRFKDQAALEAFEQNELPEGYRIAPTRFLESDDPEGEYFFLLNIYNAGGGSIVGGARAEWDVYVYSPDGGPDPNPGERPRFFVVEALAEAVSFDPGNLITPAEPLSHQIVDGVVTSDVARFDGDGPVPVWTSTFPQPDPAVNEVARFTREMAIGNDYIYWAGGAADRVLYDGTTYNYDAFFIDTDDVSFIDNSRWAEYLDPELVDVTYYDNSLEYVVQPLVNLESDQLRVTDEWREELIGFKGNGHQEGLMRKAVELLFRGAADATVGYVVSNGTPSTHVHFEITDPAGFEATVDLPDGHTLTPVTILEGGEPGYYLSLAMLEVDDATEGTRAEWTTYTDPGNGRAKQVSLDLLTADVGIEPMQVFSLPEHVVLDGDASSVTAALRNPSIEFDATVSFEGTQAVTMDWVESGDRICRANGVCDAIYYDAETLDVPVSLGAVVDIAAMRTPWDAFIDPDPAIVFARPNAQEYVIKRWFDVDVQVDELPFTGLDDATHVISGTGTLVGRVNSVVDSDYVYTGDALIDGDEFVFALDQQITNELGVANIFTVGRFDLDTGTGTQTVVDCLGPALLCSDITSGETAIYIAGDLEIQESDPPIVSWRVDLAVVLGGTFGTADSESGFTATPIG